MYMFRHHMQHWMRHRKLIIIALFQQHLFKALQLNQRQWICSHAQQLTKHSLNQWRCQRSSPDSNRFSRLHIQTIMNKRVRPTLNTNILHFLFSSNQLTQFNNPIKYNESRVQRASPFNAASSEILRSAEGIALCRGLGCPQKFLFPTPPAAAWEINQYP